jgi:translation initiation factor IF-1
MVEECIQMEAKVIAVLPATTFRLELPNGHQVLAHISGKLRKNFIKIGLGDMVKIEMSPYDLDKARITYRLRTHAPTGVRKAPIRSFGPKRKGPHKH